MTTAGVWLAMLGRCCVRGTFRGFEERRCSEDTFEWRALSHLRRRCWYSRERASSSNGYAVNLEVRKAGT